VSRSLPYHPRCLIVSTSMDVSTPEGLANHAKSVSCYLYEYGRTTDRTLRSKYSNTFFLYLLAASWLKQHSRFCSWRALSFIQELEKGVEKGIESQLKDYSPLELPQELGPGDHTLANFYSLNKKYLCPMMTDVCENLPPILKSQLSKQANPSPSGSEEAIHDKKLTFNAFSEAVELALKEKKAFYTEETAMTFHCIIYLSFLMTGRALRIIKDSHQALNLGTSKPTKMDATQVYKRAIHAAQLPVLFLINLLSSSSFMLHMEVYTHGGLNIKYSLPNFKKSLKKDFVQFGKDRHILASKLGPSKDSDSVDSELELEEEDLTEVREPIC
jgi:hypothetical protein